MTLDESQKAKVTAWIEAGSKLSEIQKRLDAELGVRMTYIEVRMLVDDLKLMPKDPAPAKSAEPANPPAAAGATETEEALRPGDEPGPATDAEGESPGGTRRVSVTVDEITRAGALASGGVTFSDGNTAIWYLDQLGRLGLAPNKQGYKPPAADLQLFQMELQNQMAKMGL